MRKKILLICYAFPPVSAAESFLAAKTLGHLEDYEIDVICTPPHPGLLAEDSSLAPYVAKRFHQIHRIPLPNLISKCLQSKQGAKLISLVSHFPDKARFLNRNAYQKAKSLDPSQYAALITWSQFHSAHLVGLKLKKEYPKVKWLAHFSDPWTDNPFNRFPWLTTPINRPLEEAVIRDCDLLLFTNQPSADLILKKYPVEWRMKSRVIPHPYDPELYPQVTPPSTGKFILRYLGKFYGPRTADPLLNALEKLEKQNPELLNQFQIELIGGKLGSKQHRNIIEVPAVDYLTSLSKMSTAHALLVIDAGFDFSVFLPSKLVDYIGSKRPIYGITPEGVSKKLILALGGDCASPKDSDDITRLLARIAADLNSERQNKVTQSKCNLDSIRNEYSTATVAHLMKLAIQ